MRKAIGWILLVITGIIIFFGAWDAVDFFSNAFGFWGGLLSFALLPITYFLLPILRIFFANTLTDFITTLIVIGLFYLSTRLLSNKSERIRKLTKLTIEDKYLPHIETFELLKAMLAAPFSYYMILFSAGLTTAIGAALIAIIYYGESFLIQRVHTGILFLLGLGVLIGVLTGLWSMISGLRKKKHLEIAIKLTDEGSPIFGLVDEVADKVGSKVPENILISFSPDLHVHQVKSLLLDGTTTSGRTLTIGLPYLKYLTTNQLKAIIAHEMAHFTGNDTAFSLYVFPAYKSFQVLIDNLSSLFQSTVDDKGQTQGPGWTAIPNFIPFFIMIKYFEIFKKFIAGLDRIREARADMIGAVCYGSNVFGEGLTEVSKLGPVFSEVSTRHYIKLYNEQNQVFINYFEFFDKNVLKTEELKVAMDNIIENDKITSELDTHFSLKARLAYLPDNEIKDQSKPLLGDKELEGYEKQLSDLYGSYVSLIIGKSPASETQQEPPIEESAKVG